MLLAVGIASPAVAEEFRFDLIGWQFDVPAGWERTPDEEIKQTRDVGLDAVSGAVGEKIVNTSVPVLYLQSAAGRFTSDAEGYDVLLDGPYSDNQDLLFDVLLETFSAEGIQFRHERSSVVIDDVEFRILNATFLGPDGKTPVAEFRMFDGLIGATGLAISYICILPNECSDIHDAILNSRFDP